MPLRRRRSSFPFPLDPTRIITHCIISMPARELHHHHRHSIHPFGQLSLHDNGVCQPTTTAHSMSILLLLLLLLSILSMNDVLLRIIVSATLTTTSIRGLLLLRRHHHLDLRLNLYERPAVCQRRLP